MARVEVQVNVSEDIKLTGGQSVRLRMNNTTVELIELGPQGGEKKVMTFSRANWKVAIDKLNELDASMGGLVDAALKAASSR